MPEILTYMRQKLINGEVPGPDSKKKARRKEVLDNRDDEDAGRIRWMFADHSCKVCYTDAKGAKHHCAKFFKVAREDALGKVLDAELYKAVRAEVLKRARAFWNRMGKSRMEGYSNVEANDSDGSSDC